jgi:hypothetical protein
MIDQITFANLFNRATPDLVAQALRQYHRDKLMAQQQADKAANEGMIQGRAAQAEMAQQLQGAQQQQKQEAMDDQEMLHQQEMEKIAFKENAKTERDLLKNQGL